MKIIIQWLAKVFNVNIMQEQIVVKDVKKIEYVTAGVIDGDVEINGNLIINGKLSVSGGITFMEKED